ncbi:single-stranded-DNA-specific exonuclease RecJ [Candidatus Pantoea carbekii]|uniref:single-stranded-DNA-specific exonuclease RecJ n=1 Tax=Candidatus Pantoea carbekii TaxID=1235990 RepID=UPI0006187A98|nr:single-stranded-DNA-specific exonuclease RecJ [Candidatus Pantoea carbekii]AKC32392.1 single-stranded-DNA-specific exonuclease RecJ [Candidatus Pantoea carbekii]
MRSIKDPLVELRRRKVEVNTNLLIDLPPLLRQIYLHRGIKKTSDIERSTKYLLPWHGLNNINSAVRLLYKMLQTERRVLVVGDFDADGATSTALTVLALRSMGGNIDYLLPNRFKDGYGLSPKVVQKARNRGAEMILTVDNGISSYAGVETCHRYGIPVLVTDHHLPNAKLPLAEAIVNPNLLNSTFPSRSMAGVGVAFYLMVALRAYLKKHNWFNNSRSEPNLAELLDLVALGTIADLAPLDCNNRILVWQGLMRIRAGKCRKGIRALLNLCKCNINQLVENDLAFNIGPRLNAAGRLDDMSVGVALLLSNTNTEAKILANKLDMFNQTRKKIEYHMQRDALAMCNMFQAQYKVLPQGLVFYSSNWHQGVIGVLASRLKERFRRPVIAFAPAEQGVLKGSGRSISGLHLYNVLKRLNSLFPSLIIEFGGHSMAVGLCIEEVKYKEFCKQFVILINQCLKGKSFQDIIWSDGELNVQQFSLNTAQMLREAGPWGQAFPEPIFDGKFKLLQQRLVGGNHLKVIVCPLDGNSKAFLHGIVFNVDTNKWPNYRVYQITMAYKLGINEYRGNKLIQLNIHYIWPQI